MSLPLPISNPPNLSARDHDAWLLAYALWYQHFLDMAGHSDRLAVNWSHEMVRATLQPACMELRPGRTDAKFWERFDRIRPEFERNATHWLALASKLKAESVSGPEETQEDTAADPSPDGVLPACCPKATIINAGKGKPSFSPAQQLDLFG